MTETNRIELKRELTDELDIEKEVIAFLNNREGGIIYVGIDKDGSVVGVKDIDGDMLKIKDRIRKNISPSPMGLFDVLAENVDGTDVIKIFLASGSEKPYYKTKYGMSTRGCYIRVGTAAEPMTTDMIENLFAHRVRNSLRNIASPRQDLTFSQLRIYYQEKKLPLNDNYLRNLELLTDDGRFNYVAYLLADENGMSIKLGKYTGTDRCDLISNNEFGYCCLLTATKRLLDKLDVENEIRTQKTYPYRIDTPLWDKNALRELVINAIVHNSYFTEVPPKFEIFSDRLEITSCGRLPEDMTEDEFFNGVSNPRNKELMRVFRDVEMVEALGSGMMKVMQVYDRSCFTFMPNFTRITIKNFNATANVALNVAIELTERQQNILDLIIQNVALNTTMISEALDVDRKTVQRDLRILLDNQLIMREGGNKLGHWVAAKSLVKPIKTLVKANRNVQLDGSENGGLDTENKSISERVTTQATTQATTQVTPPVTTQATPPATPQVESLLGALKDGELTRIEIMSKLGINNLKYFKNDFLQPALRAGLIEFVYPDKPNHPRQKYRRVKN